MDPKNRVRQEIESLLQDLPAPESENKVEQHEVTIYYVDFKTKTVEAIYTVKE